jgi:hypothetical protein
MDSHKDRRWLAAALLTLGLAACGGGGGGGGTGGGVGSPPPPPSGGTGGSGGGTSGIEGTGRRVASYGAITGFGSIFVNGVKYSTDKATIQVDGRSVSQGELALGQVVTVVGTLDQVGGNTAVADTVTYTAPIVGPIQSIDVAQATLVVLGQPVLIDGATQFAEGFSPASIAGLAVGMQIEVSGFRDSRGVLAARSVALRGAGQSLAATGDAKAVDAAAKRLSIGTLVVDYSAAELAGFGGRQPANGDFVRAEAGALQDSGTLKATRLALVDRKLPAKAGESGHLQGRVTRFASATDFDVDGYRVTTDGSTKFNSYQTIDGFGGLRLDRFVTVFGVLLADGRVLATNIETSNLVTINATIDAVSPYGLKYGNADCLTAGTTYTVDGESATWSALEPGDVAILYQSFGTDLPLRCPIVTVNHALRGPVEAIDAARGRLTVMGQSVQVGGTSRVLDGAGPRSIDALSTLQPGDVLEVAGYRASTGTLAATRLALASPDAPRQVTGPLEGLDAAAKRFRVGALTVDYSSATLVAFPSGGVAAGQRVIVRGTQPAPETLRASYVEYDSPLLRGTAVGPAHVLGPITRFVSATDFDVEGRRHVEAPPAPTNPQYYAPCVKERLARDAFVTTITATQPVTGVDFAHVGILTGNYGRGFAGETVRLTGPVQAIDVAARSVLIGGQQILLHPFVELWQDGDGCGRVLKLDDLAVGDTIAFEGSAGPGRQVLIGGRGVRLGGTTGPSLRIAGPVAAANEPELFVEGMRVRTTAATSFANCSQDDGSPQSISAPEFWALARYRLARDLPFEIEATGAPSPGTLDLLEPLSVYACVPTGDVTGTVRGVLDSIDVASRALVLLGMTMQVASDATVEDRSSGTVTPTSLDQVAAGQMIEVSLRWSPVRRTLDVYSVAIVDRSGAGTSFIDADPDALARPDIVIFGRPIRTDERTEFSENGAASSADVFFGGEPAAFDDLVVEVQRESDGTLRATKVTFLFWYPGF